MLEVLFAICMLIVFGKLLIFGIKAAWGVTKLCLSIVFLPAILIGMAVCGLIYLAFPILIIIGLISLIKY